MNRRRGSDHGQAAVELALALPLVCLMMLGVAQVGVLVGDRLAVQLAAREAARAAAVSPDRAAATAAALAAVRLRPLDVRIDEAGGLVTATVGYVDHTDVALVGALLPTVTLSARVTMAVEPP